MTFHETRTMTIVNNSSQYNDNLRVTCFIIGTRINFEHGKVGIINHRRIRCGGIKTKG